MEHILESGSSLYSGFSKVYYKISQKSKDFIRFRQQGKLYEPFFDIFTHCCWASRERSKVDHNLVPFNTFFLVRFLTVHLLRKSQLRWEKKLQGPPLFTF